MQEERGEFASWFDRNFMIQCGAVLFYLLWLRCLPAFSTPRLDFLNTDIPTRYVTWLITFVVLILAERFLKKTLSKNVTVSASIMVVVLQVMLVFVSDFVPRLIINAISGVVLGMLLMQLCMHFSLQKPHTTIRVFVAAMAVLAALIVPIRSLETDVICLISSPFPLLSALCLVYSKASREPEPWQKIQASDYNNEHIPWRETAAIFVLYVVNLAMYSIAHLLDDAATVNAMGAQAQAVMGAVLFVVVALWFCEYRGHSFVSTMTPLAVCMFIGFAIFAFFDANIVGVALFSGGCFAMQVYWIVFFCGLSYRYHLPAVFTCGVGLLAGSEIIWNTGGYLLVAAVPSALDVVPEIAFVTAILFAVAMFMIQGEQVNKLRKSQETLVVAASNSTAKSFNQMVEEAVLSAGLTARESEIICLIIQGRSNAYIAEKLFLSPNTVKSYIRNAEGKLGVSGKQELISDIIDRIDSVGGAAQG